MDKPREVDKPISLSIQARRNGFSFAIVWHLGETMRWKETSILGDPDMCPIAVTWFALAPLVGAVTLSAYGRAHDGERGWNGARDPSEYESASWYNAVDPARDQSPDTILLLHAVEWPEGSWVADIGAGGGYVALKLASLVGPSGAVIATEVDCGLTARIDQIAREQKIPNLRTRCINSRLYDRPLLRWLIGDSWTKLDGLTLDGVVVSNIYYWESETIRNLIYSMIHLYDIALKIRSGGYMVVFQSDSVLTDKDPWDVEELVVYTEPFFITRRVVSIENGAGGYLAVLERR